MEVGASSPTSRSYPPHILDSAPPANAPSHLLANPPSSHAPQYPDPQAQFRPPSGVSSVPAPGPAVAPATEPKPRKKRQPANSDSNGKPAEAKEKKPRKPREPRDPNEPPRKRAKASKSEPAALPPPDHHQIHVAPVPAQSYPPHPNSVPPASFDGRDAAPPPAMSYNDRPPSQASRPPTSGQRYDPIRAASAENASQGYPPPPPKANTYRSPHSMSMILNGPPSPTSAPRQPLPHAPIHPEPPPPPPPPPVAQKSSPPLVMRASPPSAPSQPTRPIPTSSSVAEKVPNEPQANGVGSSIHKAASPRQSISLSKAPPKRDVSPPSISSQLLANGALNGRNSEKPKEFAEVANQCIVIEIPMVSGGSSYINFMKEVEQKYGFDVAHPQVAEHRRRMKEMAAAGALLESGTGSADEMNLDNSDAGSDADMGGMDEGSAQEGARTKRRQRNEYNRDDDFIDDSELAWEEQALASKDGYFVWSGPLVQDGDKPTIERADGTVKRGRGSGRGRGGASRGDASSGRTRGTGSGRGSRGGNTVRKPRVTKADRAKMESEKQERERMAATASKPTAFPTTPA